MPGLRSGKMDLFSIIRLLIKLLLLCPLQAGMTATLLGDRGLCSPLCQSTGMAVSRVVTCYLQKPLLPDVWKVAVSWPNCSVTEDNVFAMWWLAFGIVWSNSRNRLRKILGYHICGHGGRPGGGCWRQWGMIFNKEPFKHWGALDRQLYC